MTPDFGVARVNETASHRFAFRRSFARWKRKVPSPFCGARKVTPLHPIPRPLGMSASRPLPQPSPYLMVHPAERLLGRDVPMVVGPATNDQVQPFHQHFLACGFVRVDDSSDFLQESVRVLLQWLHQRFAIILAEVLSGERVNPRSFRNCSTNGRTLENRLVRRDVMDHRVVTDVIEAALNVAL